jgi:MFS superfamily sulfate permease-like transporter
VRAAVPAPRLVVLDLSASPSVDLQSAHTLGGLARDLEADGVRVRAVETHASVRDMLRGAGVDAPLGSVNRFSTVADAVEEFQGAATAATSSVSRT